MADLRDVAMLKKAWRGLGRGKGLEKSTKAREKKRKPDRETSGVETGDGSPSRVPRVKGDIKGSDEKQARKRRGATNR